jgi:mono/diheme cytochrome c family protein
MPNKIRSLSTIGTLPMAQTMRSLLFVFSLLLLPVLAKAQSPEEAGEKLFKMNCAQCHSAGTNKVVGPGLAGVQDRVPKPSEEWLIKWIKNSSALIKSGDAYAVKIFEQYNKSPMPSQALSDDEIKSILAYIANPPAPKGGTSTQQPVAAGKPADDSSTVNWILFVIILLFVALIFVLNSVSKSLDKMLREREGKPEPIALPPMESAVYWMRTNKKIVALVLLVMVAMGSRAAWNGMMGIGVYEGYQPEQPIFFSHKIHAGQNGINCVYCHSGVEKSKISNIPSANVCMNCHKYIQEGAVTGKTEIAKIYAALDFDPATQTYGKNPKPIKWVKVHTLPDHVYFNHAQHVTVGKQECATCHGPIEQMDTVRQHSSLTMGWCIDCHRKTEVKMEGNAYYNELHAKLAAKYKGQPITVDKMGGIECGKCHY